MTTYTSYDLVAFGKPLEPRERELPEPKGTEVLVRVRRSGVCHSDIHIAEGFFDLGEEGRYLVVLNSNVLRKNAALAHQVFATRLHRLLEAAHPAPAAPP